MIYSYELYIIYSYKEVRKTDNLIEKNQTGALTIKHAMQD